MADLILCPECDPNNCINCDKISIVSTDSSISSVKSIVDGICTFNLQVLAAFQLETEDSGSIQLSGKGTLAEPLKATLKLSSNPLNAAQLDSEGLLVITPILVETPNSKTDSQTATITLSSTSNRNIQVDVKVSAVDNNYLVVNPDGLYVPTPIIPSGLIVVTTNDTATVDISGTGQVGLPLSATVKISSTVGNVLSVNPDGLFVGGEYWSLSGNTGTVYGTNFLGTIDNQAIQLRLNNVYAGRITPMMGIPFDAAEIAEVYIGHSAGLASQGNAGTGNIGIGAGALKTYPSNLVLKSGANVAIGVEALRDYQGGGNEANIAIGWRALARNTTGYRNVAIGVNALHGNTTALFNTGVGGFALEWNSLGQGNSAYGLGSLRNLTTGNANTGIGGAALESTTGSILSIVINSPGSGYTSNPTVTIGPPDAQPYGFAGFSQQAQATATSDGDQVINITVTVNGYNYSTVPTVIITGGGGTGATATAVLTVPQYNTALGNDSGWMNRWGSGNTFIGKSAGFAGGGNEGSIGDNNVTFIGYNASRYSLIPNTTPLTNATAIGYNAKVGSSNSMVLGGTGVNAVNVGIGVIIPVSTLHTVGTLRFTTSLGNQVTTFDSSGKWLVSNTDNGVFNLFKIESNFTNYSPNSIFTVNNTNTGTATRTLIGGLAPSAEPGTSINILAFGRDDSSVNNYGFLGLRYNAAASNTNYMFFEMGGVPKIFSIHPTGRVGVMTTAPDNTFHVTGSLKFVTGNQGAGKFLVSDANGVADWASVSLVSEPDTQIVYGTGAAVDSSSNFIWNYTDSRLGVNATPASRIHLLTDAIGTTQSDANGILLQNSTAAADGAQQLSPGIVWEGFGWRTNATAESQSVRYRADVLPVQGTASPSALWTLASSIAGGAYTNRMTVSTTGAVSIGNSGTNIEMLRVQSGGGGSVIGIHSGASSFFSLGYSGGATFIRSTNMPLQIQVNGVGNLIIGTSSASNDTIIQSGVSVTTATFTQIAGENNTQFVGNVGIGAINSPTSATNTLTLSTGTAPSASVIDGFSLYSADVVAGNAAPHFRTENGDIIILFKGAALTVADTNALNTGDATSDTVITNMRTRIGELEARLQAHGLLT